MVSDNYNAILKELSEALQIEELHSDNNNSCLIKFKDGFRVQIEPDLTGPFLIIGADLGDVSAGRYRENILCEALRANDLPHPIHGILAYSTKTNHLILYEKVHLKDLNGEKIAALLPLFMEKGKVWAEALTRGEIPAINQAYTGGRGSGMLGLR